MAGFAAFTDTPLRLRGQGRLVFITCDKGVHTVAAARLKAGQAFRMVFWKQAHHARMNDGAFITALEEISRKPNAFDYPIEYITPKR